MKPLTPALLAAYAAPPGMATRGPVTDEVTSMRPAPRARQCGLCQPEAGFEVDGQGLIERFLFDRTDHRPGVDRRVVYDDVEPVEALHRLGDRAFGFAPLTNVTDDRLDSVALGAQGGRHGIACAAGSVGYQYLGASTGQDLHDGSANATAATRDQRHAARQVQRI